MRYGELLEFQKREGATQRVGMPKRLRLCRQTRLFPVPAPSFSLSLFGFRNRNDFLMARIWINATLLGNRGGKWIRRAASAAAVPDTLLGL